MASGAITSWREEGEEVKALTDFLFLGSKITAGGHHSHEIKRHLLLRRKAITNSDSMLKKQRHFFANKGPYSHSYGFPCHPGWMGELDHKGRLSTEELMLLSCGAEKDS